MLLRLVAPVKRSGSSKHQINKRVPTQIRDRMIGRVIGIPLGDETIRAKVDKTGTLRFSLRTSDPTEAKALSGEVGAWLERLFAYECDDRSVELTRRQAVALSGAIFRAWAEGEGRERTTVMEQGADGKFHRVRNAEVDATGEEEAAVFWQNFERLQALAGAGSEALEQLLGPIVDRQLVALGVGRLSAHSRSMVLEEFRRALADAMEQRARNADGDYTVNPKAERFPSWQALADGSVAAATAGGGAPSYLAGTTLTELVDGWWREQERVGKAKSTYVNYSGVVRRLVEFLGHSDALRLTAKDLVRFKDHRLAQGIAPRTVNDNDFAALRSVLGWGVINQSIPANVATGIIVKGVKKDKQRGFTDAEAKSLLRAALAVNRSGAEREETARAKRWVPWLMAYTGARVGEVAQLRKGDVVRVAEGDTEHWAINITPEAGTVKGGRSRMVPLHPHLVELGFVESVKSAPGGHLFLRPNDDTHDALGPLQGVKNRLAEFARSIVPDKSVSPNHGWRHWLITQCRRHGVSEELRRMITGHSGHGVDEQVYGEPAGLYREICKLPKIGL